MRDAFESHWMLSRSRVARPDLSGRLRRMKPLSRAEHLNAFCIRISRIHCYRREIRS